MTLTNEEIRRRRFNGLEVGCTECGTVFRIASDTELESIEEEAPRDDLDSTWYTPRDTAVVACEQCGEAVVVSNGTARKSNGEAGIVPAVAVETDPQPEEELNAHPTPNEAPETVIEFPTIEVETEPQA